VQDWRIPVDRLIVNRINTELRQGLWVLQSFRDTVDSGRSTFAKVTGDRFLKGRGKDLFKFTYEFPGLYTQEGWNDYMRAAIKSKGEALSQKYKDLNIDRPADKIEAELRETYLRKYREMWDEFLKGVQLVPFQNMEDAANKMKVL